MVESGFTLCRYRCSGGWVSLRQVDLPVMARALQAAQEQDWSRVSQLDELAWALRPTRQLRESAGKVGRQQWRLYEKTWGEVVGFSQEDVFQSYQAPVVAGVVFGLSGVPVEGALRILAYQTFSALLQSTLKLLPIGPQAVQELLHEAMSSMEGGWEKLLEVSEQDLGTFNPLWDIAASRHERAEARLFLS